MRLELNLPALERLLAGDTEVEAALRQQVTEAFARKHVKKMVTEPLMARLTTQLTEELKAHLGERVWGPDGQLTVQLREAARRTIDDALRERVARAANASFEAEVEQHRVAAAARAERLERQLMGLVSEKVQEVLEAVERGLDRRLDEAFEARVRAEVQRRLDAARGMT